MLDAAHAGGRELSVRLSYTWKPESVTRFFGFQGELRVNAG